MATESREGASSLAKMMTDKLLNELKASVAQCARAATFACGGSFPIQDQASQDPKHPSVRPIQIRYDNGEHGQLVTLPTNGIDSPAFQQLLRVCTPASFGRGGEEVMYEEYRKASKLGPEDFLTSFCPYEAGIIDIISQLLLPNATHEKDKRSVRAELYKLNVYSSPCGRFKAHVDTPRSDAQFASLVVALPVAHEGGELVVRSAGKQLVFDWSTATDPISSTLKFAAFYSDCEHEVLEVTSGHRVTLTYNLYVTRGNGHLAGIPSGLDPTQLPIYDTLKNIFDVPSCFPKGGMLGIWLTHSYAHTNGEMNFLPSSLKGADMMFYETAIALGLQCSVQPILCYSMYADDDDVEYAQPTRQGFATQQGFDEYVHSEGCVYGNDEDYMNVISEWSEENIRMDSVTWLNEKRAELAEPALAYAVFGNDPSVKTEYSYAVLLIDIPPSHERAGNYALAYHLRRPLTPMRRSRMRWPKSGKRGGVYQIRVLAIPLPFG
ncbi:hypothetical protein LTR08_003317 [Meristemomyces frigidus]|nr:hypothetical protein LTR08_003317 [Meristemomyces frigidus]